MRKRIKATGFSDWDSMFYNNLLSIPVLLLFSFVIEDWGSDSLNRNLCVPSLWRCGRRELAHMTLVSDTAHPRPVICFSSLSPSRGQPRLGFHTLQRGASA